MAHSPDKSQVDMPAGRMLTAKQAAAYLGIDPCSLNNWRSRKQGPAYVKVGGRVVYPEGILAEYVVSHLVVSHLVVPDTSDHSSRKLVSDLYEV